MSALDPIDAQASLIEALRRRKAVLADSNGSPLEVESLSVFAVPAFDMTAALSGVSHDRLDELLALSPSSPPPFDKFAIIHRASAGKIFYIFVEQVLSNDRRRLVFRHDNRGWQMLPPGPELRLHDVAVVLAIAILANRGTIECEPQSSFYLECVNRGREKGGLSQLAPTIRVGPVSPSSGATAPGTGSPKSPHDRRSHLRHLRNGRTIAVRSSRIRGGGEAPRFYEVVS